MKYINPGFPQLMDYQTLNVLTSGTDKELAITETGHYLNISVSDNDVLFKEVEDTESCHLLFDICFDNEANSSFINEWTTLFEIYNDKETSNIHSIAIVFKQYKTYNFALGIMINGELLGQPWYISSNEIKSFEFYFNRGETTTIEIYNNNVLLQSILGEFIPQGTFNRFNFYCHYYNNLTIAISHIIYNDTDYIGNERIKMLNVDTPTALLSTEQKSSYIITETLNSNLYSNIVSLGIITNVNNNDRIDNTITEYINNDNVIGTYTVPAKTSIYHNTNINIDPRTNTKFKVENIPNTIINISNKRTDN